ncbi:tRNA (adenosine(37)-N6)-threonylcarbamoyltransferase complex dimerization subunit type 1 TsaB [Siculibacillus lacustris]|uniref:tRNA (Adenosine(37)-N6)-threonylcarbamoyltransferase complex dimerization subunit type 1 TsaB n=1 Tax=Siculibacillus lacustris TaxID=1549641 RepID=A0A4Q9VLP4_9HYPH|nr:tRNA (adenosine(37)-N6)-threonylcarbamoyltransferase complex dimerization subunit type 1 TsaB [Siculibacillus lacustris]TBW36413.1 tRNA (adenosine(37)-N6)-threonylcarbamoyltransferase complex dimerization subunit type 1 TsaB [Siculibacillus lacustris]
MILLAVDTALAACSAAVAHRDGEGVSVTARGEVIGRGHAERLMAVIAAATEAAGVTLAEVEAFAVTVGPGSFTGLRVGVAAVRGFALATGRPALAIGTLEALAAEAALARPGRSILAVLDARKDEVYVQSFDAAGAPLDAPAVATRTAAAARAVALDAVLIGSGALPIVALEPRLEIAGPQDFAAIETIAHLAFARFDAGAFVSPRPLYLRPPDAKPQTAARLARLTPTRPGEVRA